MTNQNQKTSNEFDPLKEFDPDTDDPRFLIKKEDEGRLVALAEKLGWKDEDIQTFYVMAVEGVDSGGGVVTRENLEGFVEENSFINSAGHKSKPMAFFDREEDRLVGFIPKVSVMLSRNIDE